MHPVLFKLGPLEIRSYGFMLAISFMLGIWLSVQRAKKRKVDPNQIMDLSVLIIISAILGSRLLYVLFHLDEFRGHWLDTINPFQSDGQIGIAGLTLLGGVLLSFLTTVIYLRIKKLPFLRYADIIVPLVALGEAITRLGCYLNGCCFGLPCEHGPFCVIFPHSSPAGAVFGGVPVYPSQLFQSFYALLMFGIMIFMDRKERYTGFQMHLFLILYGIGRFSIDFFRYYEDSMVILSIAGKGISLNQLISLAFVVLGLVLMWMNRKKQALTTLS
jgi:phosphatidylglycerol---prolipoprotein diacylglyceryl transferase